MCHFITLIAESDDADMLDAAMRTHGRRAQPIDNPSVRRVLKPGEHQYVSTAGHCDCGTVFAKGVEPSPVEVAEQRERQRSKLAKKGWSASKIERWFEDSARTEGRPSAGVDSVELWAEVLRDLLLQRGVRAAGLLAHDYRGYLVDEAFEARRIEVRLGDDLGERLSSLREDQLLMVVRA